MSRPAEGAVVISGGPCDGGLRCATTREATVHAGAVGTTACASGISIPATRAAGPAGTQPQAPVIAHEASQDNEAPVQGIGAR